MAIPALPFTRREHFNPVAQALHDIEVPIIAAINGASLGAGLGLALASDIRIARRQRQGQHRFCQVLTWPLILRCRHPWRRWSLRGATARFMLDDTTDADTVES